MLNEINPKLQVTMDKERHINFNLVQGRKKPHTYVERNQ